MSNHVFGLAISLPFIPLINGQRVEPYSLVSARIYADTPTDAQKLDSGLASTGHIGSRVTTWTVQGEAERTIVFPALTDSDPHSSTQYETYYVVVNFLFESGGPEQFVTEAIHVYRPDALTSKVRTNYLDVFRLERKLEELDTPNDIEGFVKEAKGDVFLRYEGMGYEQRRMFDLEKLERAVVYRAAALACLSHYGENATHWKDKYTVRNEQYESAFKSATPGFDINDDGVPDPDESIQTRVAYVSR